MVNGTPVRSDRISVSTSDDGVLVGKGPSVSEGVTVQLPVVVPVDVPVPDVEAASTSVFVQPVNGITMLMPSAVNPFFKKSLRFM